MKPRAQFENAEAVSLEEMLNARERRAETQRSLIEKHSSGLISFVLNIPGQFKAFTLADETFDEGMECIEAQVKLAGGHVLEKLVFKGKTGSEAYFAVDLEAGEIKKRTVAIEDGHALGRLFDIDVFNAKGESLRGADIGRSERTCIVCGGSVWACSRNRTHSAEELSLCVVKLMQDYFSLRYADWAAELAVKALLYEVSAAPKPGLVDRVDNGAHGDMDIFTFIGSALSLTAYFRDITLKAIAYEGRAEALLPQLRYPGIKAEEKMFFETKGINTHKGAIFTFGILCACLGMIYANNLERNTEALLDLCKKVAGGIFGELNGDLNTAKTHGERAYAKFGLGGIRYEAAKGYPSVWQHGFPALKKAAKAGNSLNDAGIIALLHLIANVDDTNIVTRSDLDYLRDIKKRVSDFLKEEKSTGEYLAYAGELNKEFIEKGVSPGGSADLLAAAYFLYFFETDERKNTI